MQSQADRIIMADHRPLYLLAGEARELRRWRILAVSAVVVAAVLAGLLVGRVWGGDAGGDRTYTLRPESSRQ